MRRSLPPPIALRAFEAAARHLSFTRAAKELNVTQAAISHQVKSLEGYMRVPLFIRLTRRLLLTREGQSLYSVVNEYFDKVENVSERIRNGIGNETIDVSLTPHFSVKWLTVRLSRFWELYPNIDLRLHHSPQPEKYDQDEIDVSINWGMEDWPNLDSKPLLRSRVVPVCSPKLITAENPLDSVEDLRHHTLLHESDYDFWDLWLKRAGAVNVNAKRGSTMDDANVVHQAAIDGQGVALGADALLSEDLAAKRLVMPFGKTLAIQYAYYIVYRPGTLERPKIKAFYEWLLMETAADGSHQ